jgi:hypothetical protein
MAKLSTPSHTCSSMYSDNSGNPHHCPNAAYVRFAGHFLCKPHLQKARAAKAKLDNMFVVVGTV